MDQRGSLPEEEPPSTITGEYSGSARDGKRGYSFSVTAEDVKGNPSPYGAMSTDRKRKLEHAEEPAQKYSKQEHSSYSDFSLRMMASMGYKPGTGLGLRSTGITVPLEESMHKGRRGLGYDLEGLEKEDVQWELEEISIEQKPVWMTPCTESVLSEDDMVGWIALGKRKESIAEETDFCDPSILRKILDSKSIFDKLGDKEFLDARQRANPFETIRGGIFQNRAAMKMANIDAVFNFMFTSTERSHETDILYFADICAGPGGFSEYVFWRKTWRAKGFGFTLKDPDSGSDFKLDSFTAGPCETFDPHYGVGGYDGDGDITNPDNLTEFQHYVLELTDGLGVHFVMADGGISVEGQENIQEILTKRLVLCQYLCALSILRTGGHFVCKVFDMFTQFSVGLFYLLYRCFKHVCIFKPVTSRPANSERYIVCRSLLPRVDAVQKYLWVVNDQLKTLSEENPETDVIEVVPVILLKTYPFHSYIVESNNSIGLNQIIGLKKLRYYVKNSNLQDTRQSEIRRKCLELWKVPNAPRVAVTEKKPHEVFSSVWKKQSLELEDVCCLNSANFTEVTSEDQPFLVNVHSWKWFFACGRRFLLVGQGRNKIMAWDCQGNKSVFSHKREFSSLELPRGTVLEVELVSEMTGEGARQRKHDFIYILDVLAVYGKDYVNQPLKERLQVAEMLCKVLNKPCRKEYLRIRTKEYYRMNEAVSHFEKLTLRKCKNFNFEVPTWDVSEEGFIAPSGVIFCKVIQDPWELHLSTKNGKLYFFNVKTGKSTFEPLQSSVANYGSVVKSRRLWRWSKDIYPDICNVATVPSSELTWTKLKNCLHTSSHHRTQ